MKYKSFKKAFVKLGSTVSTVFNVTGMITHALLFGDGAVRYRFQPEGTNSKTGRPVAGCWITAAEIKGDYETAELEGPAGVFGQVLKDVASGFKGVVVYLEWHINGCCHAALQSKKRLSTGELGPVQDFNVLQLEGKCLIPMSEEEVEASKKANPSPATKEPLGK